MLLICDSPLPREALTTQPGSPRPYPFLTAVWALLRLVQLMSKDEGNKANGLTSPPNDANNELRQDLKSLGRLTPRCQLEVMGPKPIFLIP